MPKDPSRQVYYPPVGIAHIANDIADLVRPHLRDRTCIHINTSAQPNSHPHLGTVTTLMTAYAVGSHLHDRFGLPAKLTFDSLENAPGEKKIVEGVEYQKALGAIKLSESSGESLAESYLKSFQWVFDNLSERTGIGHSICTYEQFQSKPAFRSNLLRILSRYEEFSSILSPSERVIRVRFPCPVCKYVDKAAKSVTLERINAESAVLRAMCFEHGPHEITLAADSEDYIDTNTPLRDVAKGATLIEESEARDELVVMVDGSDWGGVWNMQIFCAGITRLGYDFERLPFRFFAPVIVDWSGAKFSKTLYLSSDAYQKLPPGLTNFREFIRTYGSEGFDVLWGEVLSWSQDPKRLFRSYSVDYLMDIFSSQSSLE